MQPYKMTREHYRVDKKINPKNIIAMLEHIIVAEHNNIFLMYNHDPKCRGFFVINNNNKNTFYAGGSMRDACTSFNREAFPKKEN